MKKNMLPEAKVTITVEYADSVETITIPLASSPIIAHENTTGSFGEVAAQYIAFSCYGLFDIDRNQYFNMEREPRV
jgi:hypothetical protein